MARFWLTSIAMVLAVAAVKTALVVHFALPDAGLGIMAALMAFFTAMTAAVAALAWRTVRRLLEEQRRRRLAPGSASPVAKETVIARYAPDWGLSQAEADVAIFVAKGFSNNEIAEMRGCALATVKSQLTRIYHKSGLESRYQLMAFVTDEVVTMARDAEAPARQDTRKILPLVGRARPMASAAMDRTGLVAQR